MPGMANSADTDIPDDPGPVQVACEDRALDRLDVFLARSVENTSRSALQRAIRQGQVLVNGRAVLRVSATVAYGDVVRWRRVPQAPSLVPPEPLPLDIVYEDPYLMVVDKPAGMPVHPGAGHRTGTLVNALLHHVGAGPLDPLAPGPCDGLSAAHTTSGPVRPGIVHRLDKDTTGLLVVAKDDVTHRALARQFEARSARRRYAGIVRGRPDPASGVIDAPIGRDPRDRKKMAVTSRGRRAVTAFETTEVFHQAALLRFSLQTGRTHQIRVHARHIGHPILGDSTYGGKGPREQGGSMLAGLARQALHAERLGFVHPQTGREEVFVSRLPDDMLEVLGRLRA